MSEEEKGQSQDQEAICWICSKIGAKTKDRLASEMDFYDDRGMMMLKELMVGGGVCGGEISEDFAVRVLEILKAGHGLAEHLPIEICDYGDWESEDEAAEVLAFQAGRHRVLKWLLDNGGDANAAFSGSDCRPLLVQAAGSCPQVALMLLEKGASPFASDSSGYTALFRLCQIEEAKWLPEHGELARRVLSKAALQAVDGAGNTALHHCVFCSSALMAQMLLDAAPELAKARNAAGLTAAEMAREGSFPLAGMLESFEEVQNGKLALCEQERARKEGLAQLAEIAQRLIREGRLSVDGETVGALEDLAAYGENPKPRLKL